MLRCGCYSQHGALKHVILTTSPMASSSRLLSLLLVSTTSLLVAASSPEGLAFLANNKDAEGVVTLPSGLQYKVETPPTNASSPTPTASQQCSVHYEGKLLDGTVFDSSRKRGQPTVFAPSQVIPGWTEALQLMRAGERRTLYIPSELAYGSRGAGGKIPPDAVLIFDIELVGIKAGAFDSGLSLAAAKEFMKTPVVGGVIAPWHFVVIALLVFKLVSGGSGGGSKQRVSASHILTKDEETCATLKKKLATVAKAGDAAALQEAFGKAAAEHSTCPSKSKGGSLGEFGPQQMVPQFDKICWSAPVGEVQGPIQTGFGFHLILVTARKGMPEDAKSGFEAKKKD